MMDYESQLRLQAYLDGELSERERREVGSVLARDAESAALVAELRNTRAALADFESEIRLPESREFFWSKITREIDRQAQAEQGRESLREFTPFLSWLDAWRRWLVPAVAVAALAVAAVIGGLHFQRGRGRVPTMEAEFVDPGAFTYRDYAQGITVVWLSYPAEDDFTDSELDDTL